MPTCPNCNRELSASDIEAHRCSNCESVVGALNQPKPQAARRKSSSNDQTLDSDQFSSVDAGTESTEAITRPDRDKRSSDQRSPEKRSTVPRQIDATVDFDDNGPDQDRGETDASSDAPSSEASVLATLDSTDLDAATKDEFKTGHRRGSTAATFDSSVLGPSVADRMSQAWGDALANKRPQMTVKGESESIRSTTSTLVVQSRAVREPDSGQATTADYDLLAKLGAGGMGVVYSARQASIDRTVAVKMLKANLARDDTQREKFLSEAVVTGELDHPNIVPIYDLGRNDDGTLFYSMKQVQGTPWMDVIAKKSLQENLEILLKVADAIAFAHARGIVHRDLKPENIMLGEFGEVLVLDWGLAVPTRDCEKSTNMFKAATMGGTPAYMAPEMASGPFEDIGRHSDIYLLGAILYECITGTAPHTGASTMECLVGAAKNIIQPAQESGELMDIAMTAMATKPEDRYIDVRSFQQAIREYQSHSESIALTARAHRDLKDASASDDYSEFAKALFLFQEARQLWPNNARAKKGISEAQLAYATSAMNKSDFDLGISLLDGDDPSHTELISRLRAAQAERDARQHRLRRAKRVTVALIALVFVAITAGIVLVNKERIRAEENAEEAVRQKEIARGNASRAKVAREKAEYEAYVALINFASAKIDENAFSQARAALRQCKASLRNWEWRRLSYLCNQSIPRMTLPHRVDCVAYNNSAQLLAVGSRDGAVRVYDKESGNEITPRLVLGDFVITAVAFSPEDDDLVAIGSNDPDAPLRLWDRRTEEVRILDDRHGRGKPHLDRVVSLQFSGDGQRLLSSSFDNTAKLWDVNAGTVVTTFSGHGWWVWSASFSPDEASIVTASEDGSARIWDVSTGLQRQTPNGEAMPFTGHRGPVYSAAFSPDGRMVATGGYDKRVLVWDPTELMSFDFERLLSDESVPKQAYVEYNGHTASVRTVAFSRDGSSLMSCGNDNSIKIWDVSSAAPDEVALVSTDSRVTLRGHGSLVPHAAFSPADDTELVSGSHDGTVRVWHIDEYQEQRIISDVVLRGHSDAILCARFCGDASQIVTASRDRTAKSWNTQTGHLLRNFRDGHQYFTSKALFFPGGEKLLTAAIDGTVRIWNRNTGSELRVIRGTGYAAAVDLSGNGRWILTGSDMPKSDGDQPRVAMLWNAERGEVVRTFGEHHASVTAVAFSDSNEMAATGDSNGRLNLWNPSTGRHIATLRGHTARISDLVFSQNDHRLLSASHDNTVFLWDLRQLDVQRRNVESIVELQPDRSTVLIHPDAVTSLAQCSEELVLTGCNDGIARYWNVQDATIQWSWETDEGGNVNSVALSPDGTYALAVDSESGHNHVALLDATSGVELKGDSGDKRFLRLTGQGGLAWSARFSPDGKYIVTVGGDEARLWDLRGNEHMSFGPHGTVAYASFSPDQKLVVTAGWDNSLKIWDAHRGQLLLKLSGQIAGQGKAHSGRVNSAMFSPDGRFVLSASDDGTLKLWDCESGRVTKTLRGHSRGVTHGAFSADGKRIVSSSRDATAIVWDAASGNRLARLTGHRLTVTQAAFSPNGKLIVTGSDDFSAKVWDAESGRLICSIPEQADRITAVAFSPGGDRILTGCADHTVKLWDATKLDGNEKPKEMLTLKGHTQEVSSVSFSSDGHYVLSSSRDGTAVVWLASRDRDDAVITAGMSGG